MDYAWVKALHVGSVALSYAGFVARGVLMICAECGVGAPAAT